MESTKTVAAFHNRFQLLPRTSISKSYQASVYYGFDDWTKKIVAIKRADVSKLASHKRYSELHTHKYLSYSDQQQEYIVRLICYLEPAADHLLLAMEFCHHGSLYEFLDKHFPDGGMHVDGQLFSGILHTILQCINFVHSHGLIHCDVKPDNFLIDKSGKLKICDFGFCKWQDDNKKHVICGTSDYIAPEVVVKPNGTMECSSDIWSFGATACELAYGKTPWHFCTTIEEVFTRLRYLIADSQCATHLFVLHSYDCPEINKLLEKCLQVRKELRPTAHSLLKEKPNILAQADVSALPKRLLLKISAQRNKMYTANLKRKGIKSL